MGSYCNFSVKSEDCVTDPVAGKSLLQMDVSVRSSNSDIGVSGTIMEERVNYIKATKIEQAMFLRAQNREFFGMTELHESSWKGTFDFICLGDPQIGMGDQKKEEEFNRIAVKFINERKPRVKFVVVCGDHVHNLQGMWAKGDLEDGRKKRVQELQAYKGIYSKLNKDIHLVCVCGNHDVGNQPTNQTIQLYKEEFGDDYLAFWCGGVKFLVLNSQIIQGLTDTDELAKAHESWFDEEISKINSQNKPIHTIAMCHIPPFCWDVEENDCNFNWPKEKRMKWLDKMVEANIKKIFCAHYHRRAGGKYKGLEVVVSAALGTCIRTKSLPDEMEDRSLNAINFKLSFEGFGGTEAVEKTSGLHVVTVNKESITEKWLNVEDMMKNISQSEMERKAFHDLPPYKMRGEDFDTKFLPLNELKVIV